VPIGSAAPRLLVTGAHGFVGPHLLAALRAAFPAATLIAAARADNSMRPLLTAADRSVSFDLADADGMAALIADTRPDGLVHLAALSSVAASLADPLASWRVNVLGTVGLAEAVLRHAPGCRFVLASSAEVYGLSFRAASPLDEAAALMPANPYAASKAACDVAIGEMALRGLDAVRLRAFNHTGPGQAEGFVVASFARQIALVEAGLQAPLLAVGNLDRWRDFLDVRDVCAAYIAALRAPAAPGAIFNIASGKARRVGDILDALLARSTARPRIDVDASRLRPTDVERVEGSATRALRDLGWAPRVSWDSTLDEVIADWRRRVA
jgi:GDP-4-dehydro-6-deoxy-D-mannose reductase